MYEELIKQIKNKKTLKNVDNSLIKYHLEQYFKHNPKLFKKLNKKKIRKKVIKDIRAILHRAYGMFLLKSYFKKEKIKNIEKLLKAHRSTKERIPIYYKLYKELFKITGVPKSLLDLGCGFNPLSFKYMNLDNVKYYAFDISKPDLDFLKQHIDFLDTKVVNLLSVKQLPKTDVCFMFKLLNHIDLSKHHKESEKLLNKVRSKWLIISFPLETISGKKMKYRQNNWLKFMVERNGWGLVKRFIIGNEEFFIIRK